MSVDYKLKVSRKADGKKIAEFWANYIKSILDSEFSNLIHCANGRNCDKVKFTYDDLTAVENAAFEKLKSIYSEINEKKMSILLVKSVDIKHEIEDDIRYMQEDINSMQYVISAAAALKGMIGCVVEDLEKGGQPAYKYNGKDLPKKVCKYADGTEYEDPQSVWTSDVECEIEAYW